MNYFDDDENVKMMRATAKEIGLTQNLETFAAMLLSGREVLVGYSEVDTVFFKTLRLLGIRQVGDCSIDQALEVLAPRKAER